MWRVDDGFSASFVRWRSGWIQAKSGGFARVVETRRARGGRQRLGAEAAAACDFRAFSRENGRQTTFGRAQSGVFGVDACREPAGGNRRVVAIAGRVGKLKVDWPGEVCDASSERALRWHHDVCASGLSERRGSQFV